MLAYFLIIILWCDREKLGVKIEPKSIREGPCRRSMMPVAPTPSIIKPG